MARSRDELGVPAVRLLTNRPSKQLGLEAYGAVVVERVPHVTAPTPENPPYPATKRAKTGHRRGGVVAVG